MAKKYLTCLCDELEVFCNDLFYLQFIPTLSVFNLVEFKSFDITQDNNNPQLFIQK